MSTGIVGVPAAFPLITVVLLLFATGYVAMARYVPYAGPLYAYAARGFGPVRGLAVAPLALLAYNAIACRLYGLLGVVVAGLLGGVWWGWALAAWAAVTGIGEFPSVGQRPARAVNGHSFSPLAGEPAWRK